MSEPVKPWTTQDLREALRYIANEDYTNGSPRDIARKVLGPEWWKHPAPCEYPGHGEIPKPCICANPSEDHALATEAERRYTSGEMETASYDDYKRRRAEGAGYLAAFFRSQGITEAEFEVARRLVLDWADTLFMATEHVKPESLKQLILLVAKHTRDAKVQASIDARTCCPHDIACGIRER